MLKTRAQRTSKRTPSPQRLKASTRKPSLCKATTKAGTPCKAQATEGGLCFFHANPDLAAELGREGGKKNRQPLIREDVPVMVDPPKTAADVKGMLADAMAGIRAGRIDPKLGNALGYIATPLLKAIETADLEQRINRLENQNGIPKTN